jgi:type IV pilus assembly protein PilP
MPAMRGPEHNSRWWRYRAHLWAMAWTVGGLMLLAPMPSGAQVSALRPPDALKPPSVQDLPKPPQSNEPTLMPETYPSKPEVEMATLGVSGSYDPSGRRDPFAPIVENGTQGQTDVALPPLQRIGLTELTLIGVVWGGYGYTAMVQTPDGKGYSIRRGTRIGPNNGVVNSITERGIVVLERFTDVYGNKQEREYVKLLHAKEDIE